MGQTELTVAECNGPSACIKVESFMVLRLQNQLQDDTYLFEMNDFARTLDEVSKRLTCVCGIMASCAIPD